MYEKWARASECLNYAPHPVHFTPTTHPIRPRAYSTHTYTYWSVENSTGATRNFIRPVSSDSTFAYIIITSVNVTVR